MYKKYSIYFIFSLVLILSAFALSSSKTDAQTSTQKTLKGYAWSSNIGWISFDSSTNGGQNVTIDSSGNVSGYAWSSNIGWIKFGGLSGFPGSGSNAHFDSSTGLSGFARALSADGNGWDGWISLSGTSPNYGVSYNNSTKRFGGYAWGSDVVGWVDFSFAFLNDPTLANCTVNGVTILSGETKILYSNDTSCTSQDVTCTNGVISSTGTLPVDAKFTLPAPTATCSGGSLVASCSASPTSAQVGDVVTWTANASGGAGGYSYVWSETNGGASVGSSATLSRTYTTSGTKNMFIKVVDSSNNSDGPTQCSNSVTVSSCTADTWTCGNWSACTNGIQTRTCTITNDCPGVNTPSPATTQSCGVGAVSIKSFIASPSPINKNTRCNLNWALNQYDADSRCNIMRVGGSIESSFTPTSMSDSYLAIDLLQYETNYKLTCGEDDGTGGITGATSKYATCKINATSVETN